jgi:hypothetical protein
MASRKKNQQIVTALDSSEAYAKAIEDSDKYLIGKSLTVDPEFLWLRD